MHQKDTCVLKLALRWHKIFYNYEVKETWAALYRLVVLFSTFQVLIPLKAEKLANQDTLDKLYV